MDKSMDRSTPDMQNEHPEPAMEGLTDQEVLKRRERYGENRLPGEKKTSIWMILINQVKSPLVYIILVAAAVSLLLGEIGDFTIIIVVVVFDITLGMVQEYQAQRSYIALKGLLKNTATVLRHGQRIEVEVWELVPGDLVILGRGDKVPADGLLVDAVQLTADESILTGESEPVGKSVPVESNISEDSNIELVPC